MAESTWTPIPTAPPLLVMQKWVAAYVGMPDDTEALEMALAGIHMAIDRLNVRTWNWAVVSEDIQFSPLTVDYPLPGNFKKVQRFMMLDTNDNPVFRLPYKPWQTFLNEHQESTAPGEPCIYTCANVKEYGTISLDVFPKASWVAAYPKGRLFYYRKLQYDLEDGTTDWPSEATPFVLAQAEGFMADRYSPGKAGSAYARAEMAWNNIVRDDNNTQTDWE